MRYYLYLIILLLANPILYFLDLHETIPWAYFPIASISILYLLRWKLDFKFNKTNLFLTIILGFLFFINNSIYAPNAFLFLMTWLPVFVFFPNSKMDEIEKIKILSFYQLAIDIFVSIGLILFTLNSFFKTTALLPWCVFYLDNFTRNCSLFTEPSIASICAISGLFPNLIIKRNFLSFKTNLVKKETSIPITRLFFYIIFIVSTSSIAGLILLISFLIIFISEFNKNIKQSINQFKRNFAININSKYLTFLLTTIIAGTSFFIFDIKRITSFFNNDIYRVIQLIFLNSSQFFSDALEVDVLRYSSDLRIIGPFVAFFEALKHPFGYDPVSVFDKYSFLPIKYFSVGPNSLEIVLTYTGYLGFFIFLYLILKQIKLKNYLFLYIIVLFTDGSINKPYMGVYLIILSIISSIKVKKQENKKNEIKYR